MTYQVRYGKIAQKKLKKMDKHQAALIISWVEKNIVESSNPRRFGKPLTGNESGKWRYRLGNYRIIADIKDEVVTVLILAIGHRKDIYKTK